MFTLAVGGLWTLGAIVAAVGVVGLGEVRSWYAVLWVGTGASLQFCAIMLVI